MVFLRWQRAQARSAFSFQARLLVAALGLSLFVPALASWAADPGTRQPKIVILWASIGWGHKKASEAIEAEVKKRNPDAVVVLKDTREFQPAWRRRFVNNFYDFMTQKNPDGYDSWYQNYMARGETIQSLGDMSVVDGQRPDEILQWLKKEDPTLVISTQNHITEVIHRLRDRGELRNIKTAQVLTDYVDSKYFQRLGDKVEMTFVPHEAIRQTYITRGMRPDRVITSGIPVSPEVTTPLKPGEREALLKELDFDPTKPVILISSGSAGVGDYKAMVMSIIKDVPGDLQIIAVVGRSEHNLKNLNSLIARGLLPARVKLRVFPLVPSTRQALFMKSSDVIVGKTGGLTSTEVTAMGKPAVFLDINGGQETYNSVFFERNNLGLATKDLNQVGPLVNRLLTDSHLRAEISKAQRAAREMIRPEDVATWALAQPVSPLSFNHLPKLPRSETRPRWDGQPRVALFTDETEVASARLQLYENAGEEILAEYFLHDGNKVGMVHFVELRKAARRQAAAGRVPKVKLIIDGWGPERWVDAAIDPAVIKALALEGVDVRIFNQVDLSQKATYLAPGNFRRDHNKMVVVDRRFVVTGDRNVQNVNFRLQKTNGQRGKSYKSAEIVIESELAAEEAASYFYAQWYGGQVSRVDTSKVTDEAVRLAKRNLDRYEAVVDGESMRAVATQVDLTSRLKPVRSIRFIHEELGPDGHKIPGKGTTAAILELIGTAGDYLRVTSPYFRMTPEMRTQVETIHRGGTDVSIQTVDLDTTDAKITVRAFEPQAVALMKQGIPVYQHHGPDFSHGKIAELGALRGPDGTPQGEKRVLVTTHNFNPRSAFTDMETGWLIEGDAFAGDIAAYTRQLRLQSTLFAPEKTDLLRKCQNALLQVGLSVPTLDHQI